MIDFFEFVVHVVTNLPARSVIGLVGLAVLALALVVDRRRGHRALDRMGERIKL